MGVSRRLDVAVHPAGPGGRADPACARRARAGAGAGGVRGAVRPQPRLDAAVLRRASYRRGARRDRCDAAAVDRHNGVVRADSYRCGVADGALYGVDQLCGRADLADRPAQPRCCDDTHAYVPGTEDMQSDNRLFDDFVKLMNGAAGTLAGVGREAESGARARMREWIGGLDFVSRDEFEVVKAMAVAARDENDALKARIEALEAKLATSAAPVA
ncbi:hypothetical protein WR25_06522 [Diploscapter pachys]|uniref:Accessory factor UbiK family protein n=2 Tax=cellular organisms TaxID=131567 RepID=A0A2A2JYM5_9BILA|nr:hypothetical protein WR25_06522 [Diploscapter pachys]